MQIQKIFLSISTLVLLCSFSGCEDITQSFQDTNTTDNNTTHVEAELSVVDEGILITPTSHDGNTTQEINGTTSSPVQTEPLPEPVVIPTEPEPVVILPVETKPTIKLCAAIEITASSLNVRINPNTADAKVATVETGEQYVVVGRDGNWVNIWFDEETRWVYAPNYTKDINVSCGKVINTNSLNVRAGNSTAYDIVGTMKQDSLWVYASQDDTTWKSIWYKSEKRWVHGSYLEEQYSDQTSNDGAIKIIVDSFKINNNDLITESTFVTLSLSVNTPVVSYQVSEKSDFSGAQWLKYSDNVDFTLSSGDGVKQLYLRVKDANGRLSEVVSNSIELKAPVVIGDARSIDRDKFYAQFRSNYGALNGQQVTGLNYLLNNFEKDTEAAHSNLTVWTRQISYLLATVKHEVANTYTPITEYGTKYCANYDGGCTYKGRGYVQLTHKYNYSAMSAITGANLVDYPTRALEPDIAYTVMSYGSFHGIFTSRKLGSYIKSGLTDYYNARRVINGTDKASLIKGYAQTFQSILEKSAK